MNSSNYSESAFGTLDISLCEEIEHAFLIQNIQVPMRDGINLSLDLLTPSGIGPFPVILVRTPYNKEIMRLRSSEQYKSLVANGYIVAINDVRGRFESEGEFFPYINEHDDGFDTIEWIANQSWCDQNVGMLGASYSGQAQWSAASRVPPHLKAIVPVVSPPSSLWRNEPVQNGVFLLAMAEWMHTMGERTWEPNTSLESIFSEQKEYFDSLPLSELPERAGVYRHWWNEMMKHPTYDEFWKRGSYDSYSDMTVPALNVTGWWDMNFPGAPLNFQSMKLQGSTAESRVGQKLIIGPWAHQVNQTQELNGVDFGPSSLIDLNSLVVKFFDRWVKGISNQIESDDSVQYFVVGANEWRSGNTWPPENVELREYYFRSSSTSDPFKFDQALSLEPPSQSETPDSYSYDPMAVNPVLWKISDGPVDNQDLLGRTDTVSYTSDPFSEPMEFVGWVDCVLYASSSALDTDWHIRLNDVYPDGTARYLCHGVLRARFRNSLEKPELLTPDLPTKFEISLDAVGVRVEVGHSIRIEITSSWFTQYERNLNTGSDNPFMDDACPIIAKQRIFHEPGLESRIVLPVIPQVPRTP